MPFEAWLVSIIALVLGAALLVLGYRLGLILIPLLGLFAGFLIGAQLTQQIFGDAFLATAFSWVVGAVFGLVFAALAYFFWYAAVVVAFGIIGFWLGDGLMTLFGLDPDSFIPIVVGLVAGAALAAAAFLTGTPLFWLVVVTALNGAHGVVAGLLILFGVVEYTELGNGVVNAIIANNAFWWIAAFALAVVGIFVQLRSIGDFVLTWRDRGGLEGV